MIKQAIPAPAPKDANGIKLAPMMIPEMLILNLR